MNIRITILLFVSVALLTVQCKKNGDSKTISATMETLSSQTGKKEYLQSPYVTAGDRLYMVGHQDGSFPDLGWHVEGEMGGIWDHPIKLMDGFAISVRDQNGGKAQCLDKADSFINYPLGNQHIFNIEDSLKITRTQFVPDGIEGIAVELSFKNSSSSEKALEISFTGMIDLMPVWLSDSLGIKDGADTVQWDEDRQVFIAKDAINSWFTAFGSSEESAGESTGVTPCSINRKGNGMDATIVNELRLGAEDSTAIRYFIAGSNDSKEEAVINYEKISTEPLNLLRDKLGRYDSLKKTSDLSIPDKEIEEMYTWLKYNTDWLVRDVEETGRGLSAGIPDYPWWFAADNAYALQGMLATGRFDEVIATVDLLYDLSEKANGNGRVIHEASTNGAVYNKGNMNETPHIIYLLWKIYEWTGNKELLNKYYDQVKSGLDFMLNEQDKDGNMYPNGHGMMEIRGLDTEMIDVAVYTQQGLQAAANMAQDLLKPDDQQKYQKLADELKQKINNEWWVEDFNSYADFRATQAQTLALIEDAIVRADTLDKPWAVEELQNARNKIRDNASAGVEGYVVHHNWVVNTPMEMAIADSSIAQRALNTARKYTSRFGMYVTGIDRDEARERSNKWEVFSYVGAVMTLPTGVQAIAEASYGNIEESYEYIRMLENSFSYALPGSMYEVSPDYGMIVQAWNIYAAAVPIVEHYFGIRPKAYEEKITIAPQMPGNWDKVSLRNIRIGENAISIEKETYDNLPAYTIEQEIPEWEIKLTLPYRESINIFLNGKNIEPEVKNGLFQIYMNGKSNKITLNSNTNR